MLIFVSGFLSVANVGKKMAAKKNLLKRRGLWLILGYKCAKILSQSQGKNIYAVD